MNIGGTVSIDESRLLGNTVTSNAVVGGNAVIAGGAIYSQDLKPSSQVVATASVAIANSVISSNTVTGNNATRGGGVAAISGSLTLSGTTVANNELHGFQGVAGGGGIYSGNTLTITDSLVSGNSATVPAVRSAALGGGIFTIGTLILQRTTVSLNTINSRQGIAGGGGIYADDRARIANARLQLANCTIADNQAQGSQGLGGGLALYLVPIQSVMDFCTVAGNSASTRGGGIYSDPANTPKTDLLSLRNSIVAGNIAPKAQDISGAFITGGYNLVQRWSGALVVDALHLHRTDLSVNSFAQVGIATQLHMNGGPTPTLALQAGSPAIHAIPAAACDVATDQRGVKRPQQGACDIGAYEER